MSIRFVCQCVKYTVVSTTLARHDFYFISLTGPLLDGGCITTTYNNMSETTYMDVPNL